MQLLDIRSGSARDRAVSAVTGTRHTHGVVIGGGLTGLLPAVYPHVHIARGPGSLDTLLPGLTSELVTLTMVRGAGDLPF